MPKYHLVDKKLFTPGPLLTSLTVKKAQLQDLGSRDSEFIELVQVIQKKILELAGRLLWNLSIFKIYELYQFKI